MTDIPKTTEEKAAAWDAQAFADEKVDPSRSVAEHELDAIEFQVGRGINWRDYMPKPDIEIGTPSGPWTTAYVRGSGLVAEIPDGFRLRPNAEALTWDLYAPDGVHVHWFSDEFREAVAPDIFWREVARRAKEYRDKDNPVYPDGYENALDKTGTGTYRHIVADSGEASGYVPMPKPDIEVSAPSGPWTETYYAPKRNREARAEPLSVYERALRHGIVCNQEDFGALTVIRKAIDDAVSMPMEDGEDVAEPATCPECNGSGEWAGLSGMPMHQCRACKGRGTT